MEQMRETTPADTIIAPQMAFASLEHDVLCQFKYMLPEEYTRKMIDNHFKFAAKQSGFKLAQLYAMAVRAFAIIKGLD